MSSSTLTNNERTRSLTSSAVPFITPSEQDPRYHLQIEMSKEYFFLTIPGVMRLLEILLSGLNLGSFAYYCTFYDELIEEVVSPIFLGNTREAFFLIANCNTFLTAFCIIAASIISVRSHSALLGSLFMFIFDFLQFLLILSASIGLILLYMQVEAKSAYGMSIQTRQGLTVTGMLLAGLHLLGCIYDLGIYVRQTDNLVLQSSARPLIPTTSQRVQTAA